MTDIALPAAPERAAALPAKGKLYIKTHGCQMNEYDSAKMADVLADRVGIIDHGQLVAEGTPAALKAEVGSPHLDITLLGEGPDAEAASRAVAPFGHLCATTPGAHVSLRVADGAAAIAPVVRALDEAGFAISSGSACTASSLTPSHVLEAIGALTHGNVRISLGRDTTEADVDRLLAVLPRCVAGLRAETGVAEL